MILQKLSNISRLPEPLLIERRRTGTLLSPGTDFTHLLSLPHDCDFAVEVLVPPELRRVASGAISLRLRNAMIPTSLC